MATAAPQAAMQMPQQGASPFADPNAMAVYDQLRQSTSPKAFGDEILAGAAQADPQAVAKFLQKLQSLNVPPEVLDALNNVVDEILANPERYDELRAKYIAQGLPEKILPARFDPQFFVALNMAIDQMIAEPSGVQSFAQGGIAELKPIAKAIASYGRNGDTMLAHITPAEARMLRRRGGSGTINPDTGLPEFFDLFEELGNLVGGVGDAIGDAVSGIGDAVQDFVESEVGQIVTTIAIGYFLGPAVATSFGIQAGTVAAAAISGFVGSAGSTLLGGGSIEDALKAGAIGGLTVGAGSALSGASFYAPATMTPGQAFQSQVDKFTGVFSSAQAPVPGSSGTVTQAIGAPNVAPTPNNVISGDYSVAPPVIDAPPITSKVIDVPTPPVNAPPQVVADASLGAQPPKGDFTNLQSGNSSGVKPPSTLYEKATDFYDKNISPSGIEKQAIPGAQQAGTDAVKSLLKEFPTASSALQDSTYQAAYKSAMPGVFATYAPIAGVGLGALGAFGGFKTKPVQSGPITKELTKPVTQRIAEKGTQRQMYLQSLPGMVYDEYGAPIFGKSVRLPTYDVPDYNSGGYGMAQGGIDLPPIYTSPPGTIGSRRVEQPYNNSDMYPNLVPVRAAGGGYIVGGSYSSLPTATVVNSDNPISPNDDVVVETETEKAAAAAAAAAKAAEQKAARDAVAQQKALRKSQGSGQMYSNINAGLAALAPESDPRDAGTVAGLYRDILRREPDAGGLEFWKSQFGDTVDAKERAAFQSSAAPEIAARNNFVGEPAYQTFGARNRAAGLAGLQTTYGPMLKDQRDAMARQKEILANKPPDEGIGTNPPIVIDPYYSERMALDRQVNLRNSQGQNATPEQLAEMGRLSDLSDKSPEVNAARDAYNEEARRRGEIVTFGLQGQGSTNFMNMGGIATLGAGGYPRRTGQISGPGTEKSDSIPAMLSDGEFVMTAKAVRGAGKGSRRAGAKKMYALMHRLEKNLERG